jgi:hypothetical protein
MYRAKGANIQKRLGDALFNLLYSWLPRLSDDFFDKPSTFLRDLRLAARRTLQFKDGLRVTFATGPSNEPVSIIQLGPFDKEPPGDPAASSHTGFPPLVLHDELLPALLPEHRSLDALRSLPVVELVDFYEGIFGDSAGAFINLLAGNIAAQEGSEKWLIILYNPIRNTGKTLALMNFVRNLTSPTIVGAVDAEDNKARKSITELMVCLLC